MTTLQAEKWLKDERVNAPCFAVWDREFRRYDVARMREYGKTVYHVWWNHSPDRDPQCQREGDFDADGIGIFLELFSSAEPYYDTLVQIAALEQE